MDLYTWAALLLSCSIGVLQLLCTARLLGKRLRKGAVLLFAGCYGALMCITLPIPLGFVLVVPNIVLLYAVGRMLGAQRLNALVAAVLAVCLAQFANGIGASVLALTLKHFLGWGIYDIVFCGITAATVALYAASAEITVRCMPDTKDGSTITALVLAPFLFFLGAEIFATSTLYSSAQFPETFEETLTHSTLLVLQIAGLAAIICTAAVSRYVSVSLRQQVDIEALHQAADLQQKYVQAVQQRYERTRSARHDIKNHITVLSGLLAAGKENEAREYLASLRESTEELSLPVNTGCGAVDVLLSDKSAAAVAANVELSVHAVLPQDSSIPDADLCVIFGNALDNAMAAAEKADSTKRVEVGTARQGDFLLLTFENSMPEDGAIVPGIGMRNIRTAARKHGGTMEYDAKGGTFVLRVLLNTSSDGKKSI